MTSKATIDEFLAQQALAFVGVSRTRQQFANSAFRELKKAGYRLFPVHPELTTFEALPCFRRLLDIPEPVDGVVVMVAPERAESVAQEAAAAGIKRIWFQQQGSNEAAISACARLGMAVVHDQCILMFLRRTAFPHRLHRGILGLLRRLPK